MGKEIRTTILAVDLTFQGSHATSINVPSSSVACHLPTAMRHSTFAPVISTAASSSSVVAKLQSVFRGRRNSRRVLAVLFTFLGAWVVVSIVSGRGGGSGGKLGGFGGGAAGGGSGQKHGNADRIDAGLLVQLESEPLKYAIKTMDDADVEFLKKSFIA
jgi:hypothetical protein